MAPIISHAASLIEEDRSAKELSLAETPLLPAAYGSKFSTISARPMEIITGIWLPDDVYSDARLYLPKTGFQEDHSTLSQPSQLISFHDGDGDHHNWLSVKSDRRPRQIESRIYQVAVPSSIALLSTPLLLLMVLNGSRNRSYVARYCRSFPKTKKDGLLILPRPCSGSHPPFPESP